jgi:integrase
MGGNPAEVAGRNRQPPPRPIRVYTLAELDALAAELSAAYGPLPAFAAATGLRPEEWAPLERRDIGRRAGLLNVCRTVSEGEVTEIGKTSRSRRQVPLSRRALAALYALPARLDTPYLWPSPRRRAATPAQLQEARVGPGRRGRRDREAGPHLRLALHVRVERLGQRRHRVRTRPGDGHLGRDGGTPLSCLDGAQAGIAGRLDAFEAELERAAAEVEVDEV